MFLVPTVWALNVSTLFLIRRNSGRDQMPYVSYYIRDLVRKGRCEGTMPVEDARAAITGKRGVE